MRKSKREAQQSILPHFPEGYSQEIRDFADEVMSWSRYLFTRRVGGIQFGYCTHCRKEYMTSRTEKHNSWTACERCDSQVFAKASGRGRSQLYDRAYFVYYEKSVIDPDAMTARGIYITRDFTGDYYKTQTTFDTTAMYLFKPGMSVMRLRSYWGKGWEERASIFPERLNAMKYVRCYYSRNSIALAVKGTPFQYSTWEQYEAEDMLTFFDLASKYPCIEYLTKIGLRNVVMSKLNGETTYRIINWRGKTLQKVLRMTTAELKELRNTAPYGPRAIYYYHKCKKEGAPLSLPDARSLAQFADGYYAEEVLKLESLAARKQIHKYVLKQLGPKKHYKEASQVIIAWRDYVRDCRELGMDLKEEHVLYPNDLYAAHQKTIAKVQIKKDKALTAFIAKRMEELEKYTFEHAGFIIRPARGSEELFREGKALNHCVGNYARRYAEGHTNLFVLRKVSDPDTPFYTMEFFGDKIIQIRGLKNCDPTPEVAAFVEAFRKAKLTKKKRVKIQVRQEVAV